MCSLMRIKMNSLPEDGGHIAKFLLINQQVNRFNAQIGINNLTSTRRPDRQDALTQEKQEKGSLITLIKGQYLKVVQNVREGDILPHSHVHISKI